MTRRGSLAEGGGSATTGTAESSPDPWSSIGKQLGAGFAALTAVFAVAGVTTGRVERILRNEPELSLLWFTLLGAGIVIGVASPVVPRVSIRWRDALSAILMAVIVNLGLLFGAHALLIAQENPAPWERPLGVLVLSSVAAALAFLSAGRLRQRIHKHPAPIGPVDGSREIGPSLRSILIIVGAITFLAGFFGSFRLAITSVRVKERPELVANVGADGVLGIFLEGSVNAAGLRSNEHVYTIVQARNNPLQDTNDGAATTVPTSRIQTIYETRTGPDQDGRVIQRFKVVLPSWGNDVYVASSIVEASGRFEGTCNERTRSAACAVVRIPTFAP